MAGETATDRAQAASGPLFVRYFFSIILRFERGSNLKRHVGSYRRKGEDSQNMNQSQSARNQK
jgi:hypothetical protein